MAAQPKPREEEFSSSSIMSAYQSLDTLTSQRTEKKADIGGVQKINMESNTGAYESTKIREEKKSAFWDYLDPENWLKDDKVSSCMRCYSDFSYLRRRRHHCRKCGRIFCKDCNKKRTIEGLN